MSSELSDRDFQCRVCHQLAFGPFPLDPRAHDRGLHAAYDRRSHRLIIVGFLFMIVGTILQLVALLDRVWP